MTTETIYITSLEVWNFGGLEHFKCQLGQTAVISGANGEGKTSLLRALDSVLSGGHDPELIHNYGTPQSAEKAIVTLKFSNGASAQKTITPTESVLEVRSPDGGLVRAPATYLKDLCPASSFDPIGFLDSDPKERAAFLLKHLPLRFDVDQVYCILEMVFAPNQSQIDLAKFNELRDAKYEERRALNVQVRDLEGTIKDMTRSLPPDDPEGSSWATQRDACQREIGELDHRIVEITREISAEEREAVERRRREIFDAKAALDHELAQFTSALNLAAVDSIGDRTRDYADRKATLSLKLGEAREKADAIQRAAGVRQAIEEREKSLKGHILREMKMTSQLEALDALKNQKLRELPIPGLDIKADSRNRPTILIDGVPLDKLNRQRQLYTAIQCVSKASGRLPLILCEVAELDDDSMLELTDAARAAGLQMVVARWKTAAPLTVEVASSPEGEL